MFGFGHCSTLKKKHMKESCKRDSSKKKEQEGNQKKDANPEQR